MFCTSCGSLFPEGGGACPSCGSRPDSSAGKTAPAESFGATRFYTPKDLPKTQIFSAREEKKPLFGWIVVIEGPDAWTVFPLFADQDQLLIGTDGSCHVKLTDAAAEPRHASIRLRDGILTITDLDTASGTFLDGNPVVKSEAPDGCTIKTGNTLLKYRKL